MKIIAKEEPNGITDSWGNTKYYSSSRITTKNKHDFKYGKIQARIKTVMVKVFGLHFGCYQQMVVGHAMVKLILWSSGE